MSTHGLKSHPPSLKPIGSKKIFIVVYALMMAQNVAKDPIRFLFIVLSSSFRFFIIVFSYSDLSSPERRPTLSSGSFFNDEKTPIDFASFREFIDIFSQK